MLESKSVSDQGLVRKRNEDSYINNESLGLWVVADGVGGHAHGDVASQLATQSLERKIRQGSELSKAILEVDAAIIDAISNEESLSGMATTIVACRFDAYHQFQVAWVGDSRAYLLDQSGISQLTSDHNHANKLFSLGMITEDEVQAHPGQHELTQALGLMTLDKVPMSLGEMHDKDYLLLCTDGLTGVISDQEIYQIVMKSESINGACEVLLARALEEGAPDNVTFSLIQFKESAPEIKASDFQGASSYRLPYDQKPYLKHLSSRPILLLLIFISMIILFLFI
ncbi:MAG: serine/threonine protein phosphatase PrpC [Oleiphilaceae bacterium]|jgi:serine/threonine protein phosphatase PrpC